MNNVSFVLCFIALSLISPSFALAKDSLHSDYQVGGVFRSFPIGGLAHANAGASMKIWGDENAKPFYGFLRGSGTFRSSGIINSASAELEFFPISFLGITSQLEKSYRNPFALDTFDCDIVHCQGNLLRKTVGVKGAITVKGYFTLFNLTTTLQEIDKTANDKIFADEMSTLEGSAGKDRRNSLSIVLGKDINDSTKLGVVLIKHSMTGTSQNSLFRIGIIQKTISKIDWTLGIGSFRTRYDQNVLSGVIQMKYFPEKGLQLF